MQDHAIDPEVELETFVAKFSDGIAVQIRAARAIMRARMPGAFELAYDNYNALAIGYSPTTKLSGVVFSLAVFPRWVSLFFRGGPSFQDPKGLLKGSGARVRHIVLMVPDDLNHPDVVSLMDQALSRTPLGASHAGHLIIQSISAKQRPRRP